MMEPLKNQLRCIMINVHPSFARIIALIRLVLFIDYFVGSVGNNITRIENFSTTNHWSKNNEQMLTVVKIYYMKNLLIELLA